MQADDLVDSNSDSSGPSETYKHHPQQHEKIAPNSESDSDLNNSNQEDEDEDNDEDDDEDDGDNEDESVNQNFENSDGDEGENETDAMEVEPQISAKSTPAPLTQSVSIAAKPVNQFQRRADATKNIKGQIYQIADDELVLPDDPAGETKIDFEGKLLGDRRFRIHTFTSPLRASTTKIYMLSIDVARAAGFRDSLYFFRKNPLVLKLSCSQHEKDTLIGLGKLSVSLKSRAVTMVSARNAFKVLGAILIEDGKYVIDDYYEEQSAQTHRAGELAYVQPYDPDRETGKHGPIGAGPKARLGYPDTSISTRPNALDFTGTVLGVPQTTFGGANVAPFTNPIDPSAKRARPPGHLNPENWMLEYAKEIKEYDRALKTIRDAGVGPVFIGDGGYNRDASKLESQANSLGLTTEEAQTSSKLNGILGIYEPETNVPFVHRKTQPTQCQVEWLEMEPRLFGPSKRSRKEHEIEAAAGSIGIRTVDYVSIVNDESIVNPDLVLPGMWDFRQIKVLDCE